MNIEEIISSGILNDYCLGLLPSDEKKKIEQMSKEHPEIAAELTALQNGLKNYALKKNAERKGVLKKRIWNTINKIDTSKNESS
jgi:hypothetical protein